MSQKELIIPYEDVQRDALSVLALAHVGDAVFELLVRTRLCQHALTAKLLHQQTVALVRASAQAAAAQGIFDALSPEEQALFRRARNQKAHRVPQGTTAAEYNLATALEALFGSLYLDGNGARIGALFNMCWEHLPVGESPPRPVSE